MRGDWFQVPCKPGNSIRWLGDEALKRYLKLRPPSFVPNREEIVNDIRKTTGEKSCTRIYHSNILYVEGGAILDPDDTIEAVLDDNDFVFGR